MLWDDIAVPFVVALGFTDLGFETGVLVLAQGVGELVIVGACFEGDFELDDAVGFLGSVGRSS